jgi:hypothetical protein
MYVVVPNGDLLSAAVFEGRESALACKAMWEECAKNRSNPTSPYKSAYVVNVREVSDGCAQRLLSYIGR